MSVRSRTIRNRSRPRSQPAPKSALQNPPPQEIGVQSEVKFFLDSATGEIFYIMPDGSRKETGLNEKKQPAHKRNALNSFLAWMAKNRRDYYEDHPDECSLEEEFERFLGISKPRSGR